MGKKNGILFLVSSYKKGIQVVTGDTDNKDKKKIK